MSKLSTRLVLSHVLVAVAGAIVTVALARVLAPGLYDRSMSMMGSMMGGTAGSRQTVLSVVGDAVGYGVAVGLLVGVAVAAWLSRRIMATLAALSDGVHKIAAGRYDVVVAEPAERELAALAADVNALAGELGRTEQRRLALMGEVAHEMRTPLTVLDGYVEGLQDGVFDPAPELYAELSSELRRLRRLSEDLSALSRAQEGSLGHELVRVQLDELVPAGVERLRPQFVDAGVDLEVLPGPRVTVLADPVRLGQVLTNLLGNALVATPAGGTVTAGWAAASGTATISVQDTGAGLAQEDLDRVFERFYRVPGTSHPAGSGIGLTIAAAIAAAHGGQIRAASPGRGAGSTFTVTLPTAPLSGR